MENLDYCVVEASYFNSVLVLGIKMLWFVRIVGFQIVLIYSNKWRLKFDFLYAKKIGRPSGALFFANHPPPLPFSA